MNMPMMPDAIEHAAPTRNANAVMIPIGRPAIEGTSATAGVSTSVMTTPMTTAPKMAMIGDGRVLAPDEGDGPFEDRAGDVLHRLRALVTRQHVAGQVEGKEDRDDAGDRDEPQERVGHGGVRFLLSAASDAPSGAGG